MLSFHVFCVCVCASLYHESYLGMVLRIMRVLQVYQAEMCIILCVCIKGRLVVAIIVCM